MKIFVCRQHPHFITSMIQGNIGVKTGLQYSKKILNDIKAGKNYEIDSDYNAGKCVAKPLVNTTKWLAVYFVFQEGEYTIYMIKLEKPDDALQENFHLIQ